MRLTGHTLAVRTVSTADTRAEEDASLAAATGEENAHEPSHRESGGRLPPARVLGDRAEIDQDLNYGTIMSHGLRAAARRQRGLRCRHTSRRPGCSSGGGRGSCGLGRTEWWCVGQRVALRSGRRAGPLQRRASWSRACAEHVGVHPRQAEPPRRPRAVGACGKRRAGPCAPRADSTAADRLLVHQRHDPRRGSLRAAAEATPPCLPCHRLARLDGRVPLRGRRCPLRSPRRFVVRAGPACTQARNRSGCSTPAPGMGAMSMGQLTADSLLAVPTRAYHSGSALIHALPARRDHNARPPPTSRWSS